MQINQKSYKWLVLPMENYVREYYGKFLLSAVAAERGWRAIIGYKGYVRHNLPDIKGVIIEMSMKSNKNVSNYQGLGWRVCAWDEEGLLYNNRNVYAQRRLNDEVLLKLDLAFLWGRNQYVDILDHIKGIENKFILTGNPRFDLLRPDLREFFSPDAAAIKRKYGKYILVNTTFGDVNHYFGRDYNFNILKDAGKITTKEEELDQIAREKYKEQLLHAFINLLPPISANFPAYKIIIRPHPSENFETWRSAAKDLPNVMMVHEGDPIPWILGAEAVIHNSCTTGVQAYLLGKPVIAYKPVHSDDYDMYLPNALSEKAEDIDQLISLVKKFTSNPGLIDQNSEQEKRLVTRKYIEGMEGAWASDRIMDELEKLDVNPQAFDPESFSELNNNNHQSSGKKEMLTNLLMRLKNRLTGNTYTPQPSEKTWENYTNQRFPTLPIDIQSDLQRLQELTGRFSNISVSHVGNDLICVYPSEN